MAWERAQHPALCEGQDRRAILTDCGEEHDDEADEHGDVISYPEMGEKRQDLTGGCSFPGGDLALLPSLTPHISEGL